MQGLLLEPFRLSRTRCGILHTASVIYPRQTFMYVFLDIQLSKDLSADSLPLFN